MFEYKEPIRISANDPICSANALEGTIIGILFDKTGGDIQLAIDRRTKTIDKKTADLQEAIKGANSFVEAKNKEIKKLDEMYYTRSDDKKEKLEPLHRQSREIWNKIRNQEHAFDKETEKIIAGKAMTFEEGFDKIEGQLAKVDDLIEKEQKAGRETHPLLRGSKIPGVYTQTGFQGETGIQGETASIDGSGNTTFFTSDNGNVGLGLSDPNASLYITQQEDKALARLNTLKQKIREYLNKIGKIREWIKELQEEKRRLILIRNNLDPKRSYKLDLNKLSAFGFEDIEIS